MKKSNRKILYIYLYCEDENILYERLINRNREKDKKINLEYIKEINNLYKIFAKK